MTYYPYGDEVLLFGGYFGDGGPNDVYQDTWAFANGNWRILINASQCSPESCPSPRYGAMMTFYPQKNAVLLFGGGYIASSGALVTLNDTWLFFDGAWHNVTKTAGAGPSARFYGAMTYDPSDSFDLLFGGENHLSDALGDTWSFSKGRWTNLTKPSWTYLGPNANEPEPRYAAAIGTSPSGWVMIYGGDDGGSFIQNNCVENGEYSAPGNSTAGWWFHKGAWTPQNGWGANACGKSAELTGPPCPRAVAALGWSPRNNRFVLYGGTGFRGTGDAWGCHDSVLSGTDYGSLNDTWVFEGGLGKGASWINASDAGSPGYLQGVGYAPDFSDDYFEIFGGLTGEGPLSNETWRFYEPVEARLAGPSLINTSTSGATGSFVAVGSGGSNDLSYYFTLKSLKTGNPLSWTGTNCPSTFPTPEQQLPASGVTFTCRPSASSYNVFRLTLNVIDNENPSAMATANWTFTITPPQAIFFESEYVKYFYTGVGLENTFSVFAEIDSKPVTSVTGTLGSLPLNFVQRSASSYWWDAAVNMSTVAPGAQVVATAQLNGWTLNGTYGVDMISTPGWLLTIFNLTNPSQSIVSHGAGPYNKTYEIDYTYSWNLEDALGFNISVPLVGGNYSLVPSVNLDFAATSNGSVSLTGEFGLKSPSIDLGVFDLTISASLALSGTFALVTEGSNVSGIQWESASVLLNVSGDFSGSIPIYGFDVLGVTIGFSLNIAIAPSLALKLVLAPTTDTSQELIHGIGVMIENFLGTFSLPISVSVSVGIGFASAGIGGSISLALLFEANPSLGVLHGWVNGSLYVFASAFCWSTNYTLASGTIYQWPSDPPSTRELPGVAGGGDGSYDTGSNAVWMLHARYYATPGYDANVWNVSAAQGVALSDIYPNTGVTGASDFAGADLFYTNDNLSEPVQEGLEISGAALNASDNHLSILPSLADPGYLAVQPEAVTLPDGLIYVVWEAIPTAETSLPSPFDLTNVALQGAEYNPAIDSWGAVHTWVDWGFVESYAVDAVGDSGTIVALVSPTPEVSPTASERLLTLDIASGTQLSNASVMGLSQVVSSRGGTAEAVVETVGGNYSLLNVQTGLSEAIDYTPPAGAVLVDAEFAAGSSATLALLYREKNSSEVVLYNATGAQSLGELPVSGATNSVAAFSSGETCYVFATSATEVTGWSESEGHFQNLTHVNQSGIENLGIARAGDSLLIFGLQATGNITQPIKSLWLMEVGANLSASPATPPPPSTAVPSPASSSTSLTTYDVVLIVLGLVDALLLAVVVFWRNRRPPSENTTNSSEPPVTADPGGSRPGG